MENLEVNQTFWQGRSVFITGHTGFKGGWLALWLSLLGAKVYGYSLEAPTKPNFFDTINLKNIIQNSTIGDIRNLNELKNSMKEANPSVIFHMAAQPLVRQSYNDPVETFTTNIIGTVNLLEVARKIETVRAIVNITTDKCYENHESDQPYNETHRLGGYDPYSSSKACSELATAAYRNSFFSKTEVKIASVRAGNVIGGGDWSDDRLIPDILKAFENSEPVVIRNPLSTRPWQHVLEPIAGYLVLAENLYIHGDDFAEGWNFGPKDEGCKSVDWILDKMVFNWGASASWELDKDNNPHEAGFLKLDCSKAANRLKWQPKWELQETLRMIVDWHQKYLKGKDLKEECLKEIQKYKN